VYPNKTVRISIIIITVWRGRLTRKRKHPVLSTFASTHHNESFACGDVTDFYSPMIYISAYSDTVHRYEFRPNSVFSELEICLFRFFY